MVPDRSDHGLDGVAVMTAANRAALYLRKSHDDGHGMTSRSIKGQRDELQRLAEAQYAATYLLVFISDIATWTDNQFGNWFDYMATP